MGRAKVPFQEADISATTAILRGSLAAETATTVPATYAVAQPPNKGKSINKERILTIQHLTD